MQNTCFCLSTIHNVHWKAVLLHIKQGSSLPLCAVECPLTMASQLEGCAELIKVLKSGGAHLDFRTQDGITALHKAVRTKNHTALIVSTDRRAWACTQWMDVSSLNGSDMTHIIVLILRAIAVAERSPSSWWTMTLFLIYMSAAADDRKCRWHKGNIVFSYMGFNRSCWACFCVCVHWMCVSCLALSLFLSRLFSLTFSRSSFLSHTLPDVAGPGCVSWL